MGQSINLSQEPRKIPNKFNKGSNTRTQIHDVPTNIHKYTRQHNIGMREAQHVQTHIMVQNQHMHKGASNFQCKGVEHMLPQGGTLDMRQRQDNPIGLT